MDKPRLLYIAGPYRANTLNGIHNNIAEARRRMEWAWLNGYAPICPHTNSAYTDGLVSDQIILDGYKEMVSRCDAILMGKWGKGWACSEGATEEYKVAIDTGLEVIWDPLV